MYEALLRQAVVRLPAVRNYCRPRFNPCFDNIQKNVRSAARDGNQEAILRPAFRTSKHPISFNPPAPIVFPFANFSLVSFNNYSLPTNHLRLFVSPINTDLAKTSRPRNEKKSTAHAAKLFDEEKAKPAKDNKNDRLYSPADERCQTTSRQAYFCNRRSATNANSAEHREAYAGENKRKTNALGRRCTPHHSVRTSTFAAQCDAAKET